LEECSLRENRQQKEIVSGDVLLTVEDIRRISATCSHIKEAANSGIAWSAVSQTTQRQSSSVLALGSEYGVITFWGYVLLSHLITQLRSKSQPSLSRHMGH
jgi:hypothetical protein